MITFFALKFFKIATFFLKKKQYFKLLNLFLYACIFSYVVFDVFSI